MHVPNTNGALPDALADASPADIALALDTMLAVRLIGDDAVPLEQRPAALERAEKLHAAVGLLEQVSDDERALVVSALRLRGVDLAAAAA